MKGFAAALWAETLKARRSKVSWLTAAGLMILPLMGGLFMIILKDPEQARDLGLISAKAQLAAGVADWPTFFGILMQGAAIAGSVLFATITAWLFGREFSDHTAKELLALPTPRWSIVAAKFVLLSVWILGLVLIIFVAGLAVGAAVDIPGWSRELQWTSFWTLITLTLLVLMLMPLVAFFASAGRGYLPALGWVFLTVVFAQIVAVLGWGDWFPWSVPALLSGMAGPQAAQVGIHSYVVVILTALAGLAATFTWWLTADQTR
jgi:ABC-2 type transport system permease protein